MSLELQQLLIDFRKKFKPSSGQGWNLCFSKPMADVYKEMMEQFDADASARDYRVRYRYRNPRPDEINDSCDVAGVMWCLFPTHFFKFQAALIESAFPNHIEDLAYSIFGCSELTILDIGAGVGTASLATIDFLHQWQQFLMEKGHAPHRMKVIVQPVENNPLKLPILREMLKKLTNCVPRYLLQVEVRDSIEKDYPDEACLTQIQNALKEVQQALEGGGFHLLLVMSNILTWIRDWKPSWYARLTRMIPPLSRLLTHSKLPNYLDQTVDLLNSLEFDAKTVVSVETEGKKSKLLREVEFAIQTLAVQVLDSERYTSSQMKVTFDNPPRSKWHELGKPPYTDTFNQGRCLSLVPSFRRQKLLHEVLLLHEDLSRDPLYLAWAKTRHWKSHNSISDEVEIKLFESDLEWKLWRFRQMAYSNTLQTEYNEYVIPYESPKSQDDTRCLSACRFEDEMLMLALTWVQKHDFERKFDLFEPSLFRYYGKVWVKPNKVCQISFANRISDQEDEFPYNYWLRAYQDFTGTVYWTLKRISNGEYQQLDIQRYYDGIRQDKLKSRLVEFLPDTEMRVRQMWEKHIERYCWSGTAPGRGIPQGHAISGLLSNVYLFPFDCAMWHDKGYWKGFFRYVDDMVGVYNADSDIKPRDAVESLLESEDYDLKIKEEKCTHGTAEDYFQRVFDDELRELAERTKDVSLPIYQLTTDGFKAFECDRWDFCLRYSKLLEMLGVFISPSYLLRKLHQQKRFVERAHRLLRREKQLDMPDFPSLEDNEELQKWAEYFRAQNADWCKEKELLADDLFKFCRKALEMYDNSDRDDEKKHWSRHVKFAMYRLTVFRHPEAPEIFAELLKSPWIISPRIAAILGLRRYGETAKLLEGLRNDFPLVRAKCAQELGHLLKDNSANPRLWKMAESGEEIERLAATEALLRINVYDDSDREALLRRIEQEDHPYVLKNLILMLPHAQIPNWETCARCASTRCPHQIVVDALSFVKSRPSDNLFSLAEVEPPFSKKTSYHDLQHDTVWNEIQPPHQRN